MLLRLDLHWAERHSIATIQFVFCNTCILYIVLEVRVLLGAELLAFLNNIYCLLKIPVNLPRKCTLYIPIFSLIVVVVSMNCLILGMQVVPLKSKYLYTGNSHVSTLASEHIFEACCCCSILQALF